jgi:hypothetical protein
MPSTIRSLLKSADLTLEVLSAEASNVVSNRKPSDPSSVDKRTIVQWRPRRPVSSRD